MAQQNKDKNHNEQVTIVGEYEPSINPAFKVNRSADVIEPEAANIEFNFTLPKIQQETKIELNPIKAVAMRSRNKSETYDNFLKAGFGSRLSPYIDFYHSKTDKGKYNFIANFFHYSSFNDIPDFSSSPFTNTHAKVNYRKFMNNHILDLGAMYSIKTNRFYGFKPDDFQSISFNDSELKQMFNLIKADVGVSSNYKRKSSLNHEIKLSTYYYFDTHQSSELNANLTFDLNKGFDIVDQLDYQQAGILGGFNFYSNNDSLVSSSEILLNAMPYFKANYGQFKFIAGLNFGLLNDSSSHIKFWPKLDVQMNLIPDVFTIFAGIQGQMKKQSYYDLTEVNPYLSPVSELRWLNEKFDIYGGLKFSIAQTAGITIKTGWKTFEDMAFYVNTIEKSLPAQFPIGPLNKFTTVYDNGNVFYSEASVSVNVGRNFILNFGGEYSSYSLDSLKNAYHKPLSKLYLGTTYSFAEKFKATAELVFNGKRYALDPSGIAPTEVELSSYTDLNLEFEYRIKENLSVFLNGTNLLNKNYELFYSYPVQGLQIMGGITYRF